jgi:ankyrin repeat protein
MMANTISSEGRSLPEASPMSFNSPELVRSSQQGDLATVHKLVESGADVLRCILVLLLFSIVTACDSRNIQEKAFDDAVMLSAPKMQALLDKGLDPNTRLGHPATGEFLLWRAVKLRRTDTVGLLLSRGAKPDGRSSIFQKTPLFQAAYDGSHDICILLLDHGADPNAVDESENNPLREAILGKRPAIVRLLLERGSRPEQTNRDKVTMADIAAKHGTAEIQELFAK